ncbi:MAG: HEAT repeat domain-containing protein [Gemmatimonadetes bacterium]|nr:HEAT repeat domain-containing protein [Gemmatimonadota bacterium]
MADAAVEELVALGPASGDALLPLLDDSRRDVRAGAIRGLGLLGDPRAGAPLRSALRLSWENPEPDTLDERYFRILSIQALGRIRDAEAADLLREFVNGGDEFERAHAGISLFLLEKDPGYDVVRASLKDPVMAIRNLTVEGLGATDDRRARELVLSATRDESWVVRDTAYRVLGGWPADGSIRDALEKGSGDPSWFVRQTVAEARRGSGSPVTQRGK